MCNEELGRRAFVGGLAAFGMGAAPTFAGEPKPEPRADRNTLRQAAARSGRTFGTAIYSRFGNGPAGSFEDARYRALVIQNCAVVVPANELKWNRVQRQRGQPAFAPADRIIGWAVKSGLAVRGHTLVWQHPVRTPEWLKSFDYGSDPQAVAAKLIADHIDLMIARYGDYIHSYDVINEAVDPATGGFRQTPLSAAMGGTEALMDLAFHTAREAAPQAELVYNDYMSWDSNSAKHRAGVLRTLEGFRKRNVPVDALGCQSHLYGGASGMTQGAVVADPKAWTQFLKEVRQLGYDILVTEMDVNDRYLPAATDVRDRLSAEMVGAYLDIMLDIGGVETVIAWDLVDRYSGMQGMLPRKDGKPLRPCPFDDQYQPTPIARAIATAFQNAPRL